MLQAFDNEIAMYEMILLNKVRKNVAKPYVFFCPQCGFKTFQYKNFAYVCGNAYCELEMGFTGEPHEIRAWKRKMVELIQQGKLVLPQGCDDDDCTACRAKDKANVSEYQ